MKTLLAASMLLSLSAASAVMLVPRVGAAAPTAGINMGAPVWNGVPAEEALQAAIATGAPHVRVNFRVDNWTAPNDTTKRGASGGGKTFFELYDHVVDEITSHGLEVYGLLSSELVSGGAAIESQAFEDAYVANALLVMDRYRDRIHVWETINEPNNWPEGTSSPLVSASVFARLHGRLYRDSKVAHAGDACWEASSILTGPLFSFDGNTSVEYLDAAIIAGRASGPWKEVVTKTGKDPIDGVGYHIYVAQGQDSSEAATASSMNANLDALHSTLVGRGLSDKKVWISEIGYQADLLTEPGQATRLDTTFATLGARADVASIQWFTIGDFSPAGWGLFRAGGFAATDARVAHASFVARTKIHAPDRAARLEIIDMPKQAPAGGAIIAKIKATNLGKNAWTLGGNVRLGAASGCPAASATNAIEWKPATATDGYAKSVTDARRFLSSASAQGESATIEVPLVVPLNAAVGTKTRFAARMVDEGVAWFGSTISVDVEVLAANSASSSSSGTGSDTTTPSTGSPTDPNGPDGSSAFSQPTNGCACSEAPGSDGGGVRGVLFGLVLAGLAFASRKRHTTTLP